jgi:hypothetical protein
MRITNIRHNIKFPTYTIMSGVRIEKEPKKKKFEKSIIEISLPEKLTSEAYLQKNLQKIETLRGRGWARMTGSELEWKQIPKTIGENIIETARKWQEKQKKGHGKNNTTFIHRIAKVVYENQFKEDKK